MLFLRLLFQIGGCKWWGLDGDGHSLPHIRLQPPLPALVTQLHHQCVIVKVVMTGRDSFVQFHLYLIDLLNLTCFGVDRI